MASMHRVTSGILYKLKAIPKTKLAQSIHNPGHYCMDVNISSGNAIPSLNGSKLYSSHPKLLAPLRSEEPFLVVAHYIYAKI